jgi:hypothetical protein
MFDGLQRSNQNQWTVVFFALHDDFREEIFFG